MREEFRLRHGVEDDVRRRARERVAAERRAVVAGLHSVRDRIRRDKRADRHAAREAFRERHDIGLYTVFFIGEELARAADARLDLVEDEQRVIFVAELAHALEVAGRWRVDAALALDRLEQHGARLVAHHGRELREVVVMDVVEAVRQRPEALVVMRLARRRQRRDRAAVEGVPRADDLRFLRVEAVRVLACDLDRALVRLRARVAEERLVEARELDELRGRIGLRARVVEVRAMDHLARLMRDGIDERRIIMAEHVDGDAAEEIEVFLAVDIIRIRPFAVVEDDLVTQEDRQVRALVFVENFLVLICHLHDSFNALPAFQYLWRSKALTKSRAAGGRR